MARSKQIVFVKLFSFSFSRKAGRFFSKYLSLTIAEPVPAPYRLLRRTQGEANPFARENNIMKSIINLLVLLITCSAIAEEEVKDYVNAGQQIRLDKSIYYLKWSKCLQKNYYKQEYLPEKSTLKNYREMVTVDVMRKNITPKQACGMKLRELERRQLHDPVTNFSVYEKDNGEYFIDFCISDGKEYLEWNLYRYLELETKSGKFLVLIAYTNKGKLVSYKKFFKNVNKSRGEMILALDKVVLPNMKTK